LATNKVIEDWQVNPPRIPYFEDDRLAELLGTKPKEDLTGFDIRMFWERPGEANNLDKVATAIDLSKGQFKFTFDVGDFIPGLGQTVQIRIITPGSLPQVIGQFLFDVIPRVLAP